MDAVYENQNSGRTAELDASCDLNAWLAVSGDADDFIFYGEPDKHQSER